MKTFHNIRKYFGNYALRKNTRFVERKKILKNFETARSAGLIFTCKNNEEFQAIKEFKNFLEERKIDTAVLGYVNDKTIPDYFLFISGFNFFSLKDLNWYYKPVNTYVSDFINKEFDILFDLSLEFFFPVHYVVTLSPAHLKVGIFARNNGYDLMIDIGQKQEIPYLIDQIKHYLSIIKSKNR